MITQKRKSLSEYDKAAYRLYEAATLSIIAYCKERKASGDTAAAEALAYWDRLRP